MLWSGNDGVEIQNGASGNTIGGTADGTLNVISGNGNDGVEIDHGGLLDYSAPTDNVVEGNYIGTDRSGGTDVLSVPNGNNGVEIQDAASGNTIGGTVDGAINVISGNANDGVKIDGGVYFDSAATDNVVEGNDIGTDFTGGGDGFSVPNGYDGVEIQNEASGNTIFTNVISGNANNGVEIDGTGATGNIVEGDIIGAGFNSQSMIAVPNRNNGVEIDEGASGNTIGGTDAANFIFLNSAANFIFFNGKNGVMVGLNTNDLSTGNAILGNDIESNGDLGINLGDESSPSGTPVGATPSGPNNLQNAPVLASALYSGTASTTDYTTVARHSQLDAQYHVPHRVIPEPSG